MRVLVTGSRQVAVKDAIYNELDGEYELWLERRDPAGDETFAVVHGGAPGADRFANEWVWDRRNEHPAPIVEVHPADWNREGRMAVFKRNHRMVMLGADLVLAFLQPGARNVGTRDCIARAQNFLGWKGVEVRETWV